MTNLKTNIFSMIFATVLPVAISFAQASDCKRMKSVTSGSLYFNANYIENICKDDHANLYVQQKNFSICVSHADKDPTSFWSSVFSYSCAHILLNPSAAADSPEMIRVDQVLNSFQKPSENPEIRNALVEITALLYQGHLQKAESLTRKLVFRD